METLYETETFTLESSGVRLGPVRNLVYDVSKTLLLKLQSVEVSSRSLSKSPSLDLAIFSPFAASWAKQLV